MGIGKAAALAFAREGATVVIVDIIRDQAEKAVKEAQAQSGDAHFIRADVSEEREVRTLIAEVMKRWKRLDVLVNNAGVYVQGDAAEVSLADWERVLAVNLTGPFLCTKHAVPAMIQNRASGDTAYATGSIFSRGGGYTAQQLAPPGRAST